MVPIWGIDPGRGDRDRLGIEEGRLRDSVDGLAVTGRDAPLIAAFEHGMNGDGSTVLEDADLVGEDLNLHRAATRGVGDAVEIAADADHALVRDTPLQLQDRAIRHQRQRQKRRLLLGEGLVDDALGRGMDAGIGDGVQPVT